jgi:hypothetical protein
VALTPKARARQRRRGLPCYVILHTTAPQDYFAL